MVTSLNYIVNRSISFNIAFNKCEIYINVVVVLMRNKKTTIVLILLLLLFFCIVSDSLNVCTYYFVID